MEDLRLHFITYNVGTTAPEGDFGPLLALNDQKDLADFYVLSLQEVSAQPHNLLIDAFYEDPWTRKVMDLLAERKFIKLKTIRMQGLVLSVFAKEKHLLNIRHMDSHYTRTGLSGMWGNKGAVSVRLEIYGCTICCVNSHLSAHDSELFARIEDYNTIVQDHEFHVKGQDKIFYHDYIFWMGDLNFRLSEDYNKNPEEIERSIEKGDLDELFKHDQLRQAMTSKMAFTELTENQPKFAPTFKFEVGQNKYDYKRRPAWCDRILYTFHPNNYENVKLHAEQKSYQSHPYYCLSDHKPVTADFVIKVFANFAEEVVQFSKITQWWDNEENTIYYEFSKEHSINKDDWIGVYKVNFCDVDDYETYEYVPKPASPTPSHKNKHSPMPTSKQAHEGNSSGALNACKKFNITFSQPSSKKYMGLYRLMYVSETEDKVRSILGLSEPFEVKTREHSN